MGKYSKSNFGEASIGLPCNLSQEVKIRFVNVNISLITVA